MDRSKKVASIIVVSMFIIGMCLGALLTQLSQNGASASDASKLYERSPLDFRDRGVYEVVRSVVVVDIDTSVHFQVDETWEYVEFWFYPIFKNTVWSCNYTLSSQSSLITLGNSGISPDAGDHAGGGSVSANRTQITGQTEFGNWTLVCQVSGGPVVVEISKVSIN